MLGVLHGDEGDGECCMVMWGGVACAGARASWRACLQKLQHGFADVRVHALVVHQLALQPDGLPQVSIRLTQDVVQLKCCLRFGLYSLQPMQIVLALTKHPGQALGWHAACV